MLFTVQTHFPCLQPLTIFQRSLTTMQIQIQGLLQFAVPLFPTAEVSHTLTTGYDRVSPRYNSTETLAKGIFGWYCTLCDLHRETYWASSICSTPQRPVCTSWPPCWTAGGSTRFVHCILIGATAAQLGCVAARDCSNSPKVEPG